MFHCNSEYLSMCSYTRWLNLSASSRLVIHACSDGRCLSTTRSTSVNQDSWNISRSRHRSRPQHALMLETGFTGIDGSLAFVNCLNPGAVEYISTHMACGYPKLPILFPNIIISAQFYIPWVIRPNVTRRIFPRVSAIRLGTRLEEREPGVKAVLTPPLSTATFK